MNNRLFISGRITGDPHYAQKFEAAEVTVLRPWFYDRHGLRVAIDTGRFGYKVYNPLDFTFLGVPLRRCPWWVCMAVCLTKLVRCSTVYMLHDWQ